jgi:mannose-6-phosphate isomerase-like protein (cupin superfamily)
MSLMSESATATMAPMTTQTPTNVLGGVGLSHLTVYEDRPGPDGLNSGCAHVHAITDEAYFAIKGEGWLELNDVVHGFRRVPLTPGAFVQFGPGTIHRAVSSGGLEVVVLIGNAGLAERGDARIYFGPAADADPDEHARLTALPRTKGRAGALERRDASITAYLELTKLWETDRAAYDAELRRFVGHHFRAMDAKRTAFEAIVREGPLRWAQTALDRIARLPQGLDEAETLAAPDPATAKYVLGMCGTLRPVEGLKPLADLLAAGLRV